MKNNQRPQMGIVPGTLRLLASAHIQFTTGADF